MLACAAAEAQRQGSAGANGAMRLLIIAAAAASATTEPRLGQRDSGLVLDRLALGDLGFTPIVLDPARDAAEQLDEALAAHRGRIEAVFFYASCLVAVDDECYLCLDPDEPEVGDSLRDLAVTLRERVAGPICALLDVRYAAGTSSADEVVDRVARSVASPTTGIELLAAARPLGSHSERVPSRFSVGLLEALDGTTGALTTSAVYRRITENTDFGTWPHAHLHVAGAQPFVIRRSGASLAPPAESDDGTVETGPVAAFEYRPSAISVAPVLEVGPAAISTDTATAPDPALVARATETVEDQSSVEVDAGGAGLSDEEEAELLALEAREVVPPPAPMPVRPRPEPRRAPPESERREAVTAGPPRSSRPAATALPSIIIAEAVASQVIQGAASSGVRGTPPDRPLPRRDAPTPVDRPDRPSEVEEAIPLVTHAPSPTPAEPPAAAPAAEAPTPATAPVAAPPSEQPTQPTTVRDFMAAAEAEALADRLDGALAQYKKALGKLGTSTTPDRAEIYVRIAMIMRKQGKTRLAITNLDKALAIDARDARALVALVELNADEGDWEAAEQAEERLISVAPTDDDTIFAHLLAFGDRWRAAGRAPERARRHYEIASERFPERPEAWQRLLAMYEEAHDVDAVIDTRKRLIAFETATEKRADRWFELGEYCMFEAHREIEALEAFEHVLAAAPTRLEALEVLATALAEQQEWAELERIYRKMAMRFDEPTPEFAAVRAELYHRLALLYRDHLEDPRSALHALEQEIAVRPRDLDAVLIAANLASELGDRAKTLDLLRAAARLEPRRSDTYHRVFEVGQLEDRLEIAYFAASVTSSLGTANDRERIVLAEHRPHGVPAHRRPLTADAWPLLRPSPDEGVDSVMRAIAPAILRHRVLELDRDGRLPPLPFDGPQDARTSTISAVRSLGWAAQFLGVSVPAIYVSDDHAGTLTAPLAKHQAVIAGRGALRGRSLAELAFLCGRHVTLRRPEHELAVHVHGTEELAACFLAGIHAATGSAPSPPALAAAVTALASLITKNQTADERTDLEEAVRNLEESSARVDLSAWRDHVERTACRAGLLLCGDIDVAKRVLEAEDEGGTGATSEWLGDMLAFVVSDSYLALREALGTTLDD